MRELISNIWSLAGHKMRRFNAKGDELLSIEEAFPDSHPGSRLRGLRVREGITQKQMAEKLGLRKRHISEMEKGTRPITLEMAKRIDSTFDIGYKVFL
ncbi:MAG: helix-turn-helix domain-containing protein [Deltaproteobacteria bacterium]|nr:helix-turn-helix domain-containing protein [Deltaproteobacteria bacterium]